MKVLIINNVDSLSGAARAAYRLHQSLLSINVESLMLVNDKRSDESTIIKTPSTQWQEFQYRMYGYRIRHMKKDYHIANKVSFSPAITPDKVSDHIQKIKPDIVHLHWINKEFIKLENLSKIGVPMVWTLHDMWAFTGGCHYNQGCEKFKDQCGSCPILNSKKDNDLSRSIYKRKLKVYSKLDNLTIITPSKWLGETAKQGSLFKNVPVKVLPNCINTTTYTKVVKSEARKILNLSLNKMIVLFGALKTTSDPRKGFHHLSNALKKLDKKDKELLVFGSTRPANYDDHGFETTFAGRIYDDISLSVVYSAADVMVVPSEQENLGNTIMESLACGTPVVAFDIGGNSDMIVHKNNGYLADPLDSEDLARGIEWVVENRERWQQLSQNASSKVATEFAYDKVANDHLKLYQHLLKH